MKIMLLGYGRAGKGTFCEEAAKLGLTAISSSKMASELGLFDALAEKHGYADQDTFYPNRHVDRDGCYQAICEFVKGDEARMGRKIYEDNDIYDGCRDDKELFAIEKEGQFDISVWINAGERVPPEPKSSMTVTRDMAHVVIDNTTDEASYRKKVRAFLLALMKAEKS